MEAEKNVDDVIDEGPDTHQNGRMSNEDLLVAFKADADDREQRREAKAVERHTTVVNKLSSLEGRITIAEKDIVAIRKSAFPQAPLWFLVTALWFFGAGELCLRLWSIVNAPVVRAMKP